MAKLLKSLKNIGKFYYSWAFVGLALSSSAWADGVASPALPADGTGAPGPVGQPAGFLGMMFPFLLMFAVVYFLMIRPQQKRVKEHQKLLNDLQIGDEVLTSSGILGTIRGFADNIVTLEVGKNLKIRMVKSQITRVVKEPSKDLEVPAQ